MSALTLKCLTSRELCETLGVSLSTLHRLRKRHNFPKPIRIGQGAKRYLESDVLQWLDEQREVTTSTKEG